MEEEVRLPCDLRWWGLVHVDWRGEVGLGGVDREAGYVFVVPRSALLDLDENE